MANLKSFSHWRSIGANILTATVAVAVTLLALEIALRFLPVADAPAVEPPTKQNPIQRYIANTSFTWSMGWNFANVTRRRTNAQGFVADYDYDAAAASPLVAVIGDSYVEALGVPFAQSLTGRLQAALGARGRAYGFAQSGSPISQYIAYARHACTTYRPERLVVLVVGNDFDESLFAHRQRNGIYHLHPRADGGFDFELTPLPPPGWVESIVRRSALALYLIRNVGAGMIIRTWGIGSAHAAAAQPAAYVGNTPAQATPERIAEGEKVIAWFLDRLADAACLPPRDIAIVVDAIRPEIYQDAALEAARSSYFGRMRAKLLADAASRGYAVVDLEIAFRAAFAKDRQPFEPTIDAHWNAHGHAVAAAAIEAKLSDWPPLKAARTRE